MAWNGVPLSVFALFISFLLLFGCPINGGYSVQTQQPENPPEPEVNSQPPPSDSQPESPPPEPPKKEGKLELVKTFYYVDWINYYHITGVVENTGEYPIKHVRANVYSYLKNGTRRAHEPMASPARLAPGERGAFTITVGKANEYDVGKFDAEAGKFVIDDAVYSDELEVVELPTQNEDSSYPRFFAQVWNKGSAPSKAYWVNGIFYDNAGNVLAIGSDVVGVSGGIKPGEYDSVSYTMAQPSKVLRITDFEIVVDYGSRTG